MVSLSSFIFYSGNAEKAVDASSATTDNDNGEKSPTAPADQPEADKEDKKVEEKKAAKKKKKASSVPAWTTLSNTARERIGKTGSVGYFKRRIISNRPRSLARPAFYFSLLPTQGRSHLQHGPHLLVFLAMLCYVQSGISRFLFLRIFSFIDCSYLGERCRKFENRRPWLRLFYFITFSTPQAEPFYIFLTGAGAVANLSDSKPLWRAIKPFLYRL